jgi:hypothetical protein
MKRNRLFFGMLATALAFALVLAGCEDPNGGGGDSGGGGGDTRTTLTPGSPVDVAATDTTVNVTFTGATDLSLSEADFAVTDGGTITTVSVASGTATVTVSFPATTTAKTYTVSIASGSAVIKGSGTVAINQAASGGGNPLTWTAISATESTFPSSGYIRGIAYGGGKFVAVDGSGQMAYSNQQE